MRHVDEEGAPLAGHLGLLARLGRRVVTQVGREEDVGPAGADRVEQAVTAATAERHGGDLGSQVACDAYALGRRGQDLGDAAGEGLQGHRRRQSTHAADADVGWPAGCHQQVHDGLLVRVGRTDGLHDVGTGAGRDGHLDPHLVDHLASTRATRPRAARSSSR